MTNVDIMGLDKALVLAGLFNAAEAPGRMGALQFQKGPYVMTAEQAAKLVELGNTATPDYGGMAYNPPLYFDYLYGRCLKLNLTSDVFFDPWGFDRDNGGDGAAQAVIDRVRETGEIAVTPTGSAKEWLRKVTDKSLKRFDEGDLGGTIAQFIIGVAQHPGTAHIANMGIASSILVWGFEKGRSETEYAMMGFSL